MSDVVSGVREAVNNTMKELGISAKDLGGPGTGISEPETPAAEVTTPSTEVSGETGTVESGKEISTESGETNQLERTAQPAADEKTKETAPAAVVEEEDEWKPSADDLKIIDANPELKKVYKSMVKGFTSKTEGLASKRKEAEASLKAMEAIKADPAAAIRAIAAAANLQIKMEGGEKTAEETATVTPAASTTIQDRLRTKLEAKIGKEAAEVLAPALLEAIGTVTGEEIGEIKQVLNIQAAKEQRLALRAGISDFGTKIVEEGGEWGPDIESEMAEVIRTGKIRPGEGATLPEFLEVVHNTVVTRRNRTKDKERQVTRIQDAARRAEPTRPVRSTTPAPKSITAGMDMKEALALAVSSAKAEVAARK